MSVEPIRKVALPSGVRVPALGQGTWQMAERPGRRAHEIAALRLGVELGLTLIDTAEMYADGGAEELVAEVIRGQREQVFLVSKVLPSHAGYKATIRACEASLKRLRTDYIDLYLLHWRGAVPLDETLDAFSELAQDGKIRGWGVSNLDLADLRELQDIEGGGDLQTDQVLYNPSRRGIEYDLLPWCEEHSLPIMAYSPVEQGRLLEHAALREVAERRGATPAQVALAWVLRKPNVIAIPKASSAAHVRENHAALTLALSEIDLVRLDRAFPPPRRAVSLEMI
ncbi:MAG TPA: aldo/keto reductase [Polyangiales bacterium]|nr:aldo/keto reductase [Polyangiales bacterium]